MQSVFFYGLFMDTQLLRGMGFDPQADGVAELRDHALRIGEKATLVPAPGSSAWGIVIRMTRQDLERLYAGPGVDRYRPESVSVEMAADRSARDCTCYNLPADELGDSVNSEYAERLAALAQRLSFPPEYVREIRRFCN